MEQMDQAEKNKRGDRKRESNDKGIKWQLWDSIQGRDIWHPCPAFGDMESEVPRWWKILKRTIAWGEKQSVSQHQFWCLPTWTFMPLMTALIQHGASFAVSGTITRKHPEWEEKNYRTAVLLACIVEEAADVLRTFTFWRRGRQRWHRVLEKF